MIALCLPLCSEAVFAALIVIHCHSGLDISNLKEVAQKSGTTVIMLLL